MHLMNFVLLVIAVLAAQAFAKKCKPDCSLYSRGELLPDECNARAYFICRGRRAVRRLCRRGMIFDDETKRCIYPQQKSDNSDEFYVDDSAEWKNWKRAKATTCTTTTCKPATPTPCITKTKDCTTTTCKPATKPKPKACDCITTPSATITSKPPPVTPCITETKAPCTPSTPPRTPSTPSRTQSTPPCETATPPCEPSTPPRTPSTPTPTPTTPPCTPSTPTRTPTKPPCEPATPPCENKTLTHFHNDSDEEFVDGGSIVPVKTSSKDCGNLPDGTHLADAKRRNRFYVCLDGKLWPLNCPAGSCFDRESDCCRPSREIANWKWLI